MARYVITASGSTPYAKGQTVDLTSAQASAVTSAGGALRAVTASVNTASTVTYPGGTTLSAAAQEGSPNHDTAGKSAGVSN